MRPTQIGVIGAGFISAEYLSNLTRFPDISVRWVADSNPSRAHEATQRFSIPHAGSLAEMLADPEVDVVLNLTPPGAHSAINEMSLRAGKHVWSEKPLAANWGEASNLGAIADDLGLGLAAAPDTILAAGMQSSLALLAGGMCGTLLSSRATMVTGGPESWHPNPEFAYGADSGPLVELGPYFLTPMVLALGPIGSVAARSSTRYAERIVQTGPRADTVFPVFVPTYWELDLEFRGGATGTMTVSFDGDADVTRFEIDGTGGSLLLPDPTSFVGDPELDPERATHRSSYSRGVGVLELARTVRRSSPTESLWELPAHVVEVMDGARASAAESGAPQGLHSTPSIPPLLPNGWNPFGRTL